MSEELSFFANRPECGDNTMETLTHFQEDVLGDVLQSIHLHSSLYCRAKMGAPWGFRISGRDVASFHIVTEGSGWLTVELVRVETSVNQVEAETIITRLSELLFIQAVRAYIRTNGDGNLGWLSALKDPQIGQALAMIQRQPDEAWTVGSLACRVNLSR